MLLSKTKFYFTCQNERCLEFFSFTFLIIHLCFPLGICPLPFGVHVIHGGPFALLSPEGVMKIRCEWSPYSMTLTMVTGAVMSSWPKLSSSMLMPGCLLKFFRTKDTFLLSLICLVKYKIVATSDQNAGDRPTHGKSILQKVVFEIKFPKGKFTVL
jgi:hypothetical protein